MCISSILTKKMKYFLFLRPIALSGHSSLNFFLKSKALWDHIDDINIEKLSTSDKSKAGKSSHLGLCLMHASCFGFLVWWSHILSPPYGPIALLNAWGFTWRRFISKIVILVAQCRCSCYYSSHYYNSSWNYTVISFLWNFVWNINLSAPIYWDNLLFLLLIVT